MQACLGCFTKSFLFACENVDRAIFKLKLLIGLLIWNYLVIKGLLRRLFLRKNSVNMELHCSELGKYENPVRRLKFIGFTPERNKRRCSKGMHLDKTYLL